MTPKFGVPGASLEEEIKEEARRLGFVLAGVTTPEPPPHSVFFESWLSYGRHGRMEYLETERSRSCRGDPRAIMPECKSIVVLAMPYSRPDEAPEDAARGSDETLRGRVAAYACGPDYHDVIPKRLRTLIAFIESRSTRPVSSRCYTDTGPILERDLAQRAGLGWIGKNTCLINPRLGSYFLLAEILLDLDLRPDAAFPADHCGSCTRCIRACPTGCILPDRSIDARQCISYLTIELREAIPFELRERMGNWVFGCDDCQTVCPWNRFAPAQGEPALAANHAGANSDLLEQLQLNPGDFAQRMRGSPIQRAKYRGFMRNVAVAAGNAGSSRAMPSLERMAEQDDPILQEHAAWALARLTERND